MDNCNLLDLLEKRINNSPRAETTYLTTTKKTVNGIISTSTTKGFLNVDFNNKTGSMTLKTLTSSPQTILKTTYSNYTKTDTLTDINGNLLEPAITSYLTPCSYDFLFTTCGNLYPIMLSGLVPIKHSSNSNCCQAYTFSRKRAKTIPGYVSGTTIICMESSNKFKVVSTLKLLDSSGTPLEGDTTTNIKIYSC